MKLTNVNLNNCLSMCLATFMLAGCGDSDLDNRFRSKLEQTKQELQAGTAGTETGGTETGGTETGGTETGGTETGGTETGGAETGGTETGGTETGGTETGGTELPTIDVVISESGDEATISGVPYDMIFGDEFTGASIDASKWNTGYQWGSDLVINEEEQYYVNTLDDPDFGYDPFYLDGDALVITASETPAELSDKANGQSYLSGAITSTAKFTTTYGYIEMRAKMPEGFGLWSGFWMLGAEFVDLKPQLFVAEHDGGKPNSVFHNYNYHDADGNLRSPGQWEVSANNVTTEFHTYGVLWEENALVYYIDGLPKYRIEGENVSKQAMYLIANLAVGGVWPGSPQASTQFPAELHIDYIRAYAKR